MEKRRRGIIMIALQQVLNLGLEPLSNEEYFKINHLLDKRFKSPKKLLKNFKKCLKGRYALLVYEIDNPTIAYSVDTQLLEKVKNNLFEFLKKASLTEIKGEEE
tara:strand:+ start:569 stop:880 length:312 start_codon:yes stop_codon:yes gene_type:complete